MCFFFQNLEVVLVTPFCIFNLDYFRGQIKSMYRVLEENGRTLFSASRGA